MKNIRRADCCENCCHCIAEYPYDDPICYYCNLDGGYTVEPSCKMRMKFMIDDKSAEAKAFYRQGHLRAKWQVFHGIRAGDVCDGFKPKEREESSPRQASPPTQKP